MMKIPVKLPNSKEYTFAIVDDEDYSKLMVIKWRMTCSGYAICDRPKSGDIFKLDDTKMARMHRVIMGAKKGQTIDHKNEDKLDNRKENLRFCTPQQNNYNRGVSSINLSGLKGVGKNKKSKRWQATIQIDGKNKYLGTFDTKEEAHAAYVKVAKELHGEFFHP